MPGRSRHSINELAASVHSLVQVGDKPPSDNLTDAENISTLVHDMGIAFSRLDTAHRGMLTNKQLGQLMENQNLHGADAATAAALFRMNSELQNGSLDLGFKPDPNGLTTQELAQLEYKATHAPQGCLTGPNDSNVNVGVPDLWAGTQFVLAHKNENEKIFYTDIDKSIATTKGDAETKKSLKFLQQHYSEIAADAGHAADAGVTFREMQNFAMKYKTACSPLWEMRGILMNHASVVNEKLPTSLYAEPEPVKSISHKGVEQGSAGDCYFESPLGEVSDLHKEDVANMIVDNNDGTYTVAFPGQTAHYTVTKPTEAERILFNKGATAGDWPTVLEKAYGLWANDKDKKGAVQKNWEVPVDYSGHAGHTDIALALLTNRPAPTLQLRDTPEEKVRQHLIDIKIDHRAVVANRARENFAAE